MSRSSLRGSGCTRTRSAGISDTSPTQGLVRSTAAHRGRPGRPRIVYAADGRAQRSRARATASSPSCSRARSRARPEGAREAERGRARLGRLPRRPPAPSVRLTRTRPSAADRRPARGTRLRARARVGDAIEMHRCPFQELVEAYGDVVCGLHRGLLAARSTRSTPASTSRRSSPTREPGLCRATLASRLTLLVFPTFLQSVFPTESAPRSPRCRDRRAARSVDRSSE